jgi:hypothetical protein
MVVPGYEGAKWLAQFGEVEWIGDRQWQRGGSGHRGRLAPAGEAPPR